MLTTGLSKDGDDKIWIAATFHYIFQVQDRFTVTQYPTMEECENEENADCEEVRPLPGSGETASKFQKAGMMEFIDFRGP